jgi:xanthine/uracil/vitamin C permease (AzgA family)
LIANTLIWWAHSNEWPDTIAEAPNVDYSEAFQTNNNQQIQALLVTELLFLCLLTLSGLVRSFSDLSGLTRDDGSTPRNRWLFIMCGIMTVVSGCLTGPPILISPESAGGIKAGAKTGLSTVVCGICFCSSVFFGPLFSAVPDAATAPLLLAIGVILAQNVKKVEWSEVGKAFPAFCCLFFIPFTYNILFGVVLGYIMHVGIGLFTGQLYRDAIEFFDYYFKHQHDDNESERRPTMDHTDNNVSMFSGFDDTSSHRALVVTDSNK